MTIATRLAALACLALTACGDPQGPPPPQAQVPPIEPTAPVPPAAQASPYVGLWAARAELCPDGAWVFDEDKLVTAGEVACTFREVTPTPTGYQVLANCTAEAAARPYQFTLTMTDPAPPRSMTVSNGPWDGPITLRRCTG